ncbi:hypothetical protein COU56_00165 [Candidatus Pacearchaeota archaeon CG10_big_fil_rev_8_21_14_0_10_31_9]|nr:MAG: hypothetical protein COU56_00165 [Candidatus Pacearchaeota archaeon CG10_big_fil_rev_8_21_14_0_10_31_9]PIZ82594.1 MAG: hypothetical protein COX97_03970 [Candidatus Pacearchaeota archaeon CG_4_10_14_0_2_um_filter_05_32_18]
MENKYKNEVTNNPNKITSGLKKFWDFVWNGESFLSWIVFVVLAFIVIKFIFFPALTLTTGTSLPLVIVESCSMYHDKSFDLWWTENGEWYEDRNISKDKFEEYNLKNGFSKGDIFLVTRAKDIEIGDTIIFLSGNAQRPIIHRVVSLDPIETKGDNNDRQFTQTNNAEKIDETNIPQDKIIGKTTLIRIPFLGWVKLVFFEPLRVKSERGLCRG